MAGAHLYVTGVRDGGGNELMFFDIPLDNTCHIWLAPSRSGIPPGFGCSRKPESGRERFVMAAEYIIE